tara:strand:- start:9973 stop:10794 length:822 start_codon:yes stop_codon:yes gene_type:complete
MKLTTKDIKRITEEELNKVLVKENLYKANIQKWKQRIRSEREQWYNELDQYSDMLDEGLYEEFLWAIHGELPILAGLVKGSGLLVNNAERFLGSLARSSEHGDIGNLIMDFINPHLQVLMDKFAIIYNNDHEEDSDFIYGKYSEIATLIRDNNILAGYLGVKNARTFSHRLPIEQSTGTAGDEIRLFIDDEFVKPQESIQMIRNIWHVDENKSPVKTWKSSDSSLAKEDMLFSKVNYPAYPDPRVKVSLAQKRRNHILRLGVSHVVFGDEDKL